MTRAARIGAVLVLTSVLPAKARAMEKPAPLDVVLAAIAEVESGNDDTARGQAGERSRYQIRLSVWREHTTLPFRLASEDPALAREIALRHLRQLQRRLVWRELTPTPRLLALAWNGGMGAVRRPQRASRDYAQRVVNLVEERMRP